MMAEFLFWCAGAFVFYAYVGYPLGLLLLWPFSHRRVQKRSITPRVSFIIAVHNEERRIQQKLDNTLAHHYPAGNIEIIVASDCSTDRTDDIVETYRDRVRLVRATERRGKEAAQQLAVEAASGDILIFSDVGTALSPTAISTIVMNFADATVGCVSSVDRFRDPDGSVSGEGVYVRYEMFLRTLESRVNTLVGLSGSFFAARREVCRHWAPDQQSDFATLLNALNMALRGVLDTESAGYYNNIADDSREFQRKVRTVLRGIAVLAANARMMNPFRYRLFAWQLVSHKLCRWLVPFALIVAWVSNALLAAQSPLYLVAFLAQIGFYLAAAVGIRTGRRTLKVPAFLVVSNLAILVAWFRYAAGQRIVAWSPSERAAVLSQSISR